MHLITLKVCLYKGNSSDKTTMQKSFQLDQTFMNKVEKTSITHIYLELNTQLFGMICFYIEEVVAEILLIK